MTMKRGRKTHDDDDTGGGGDGNTSAAPKRPRHDQHIHDDRISELLKRCLQKVCELQTELANDSDEESDAEAAGYAACAIETLRFLAAEGLSPDHPMVKSLSQKLLRNANE